MTTTNWTEICKDYSNSVLGHLCLWITTAGVCSRGLPNKNGEKFYKCVLIEPPELEVEDCELD
jgi:hypothetical protein